MSNRTVLLWPDTHVPRHHVKAVGNLIDFIDDFGPTEILNLGDFYDMEAPARWSKGLAAEYANTLNEEFAEGYSLDTRIRYVFAGPYRRMRGNHEDRLENYLIKHAPALSNLSGLDIPTLGRYKENDVEEVAQPYPVAPGWVAIHGSKLAPYGGGSAMKMVKTFGMSVAQGHSHRAGLIPETTDRTRWGLECGHLKDIRKATYLSYPNTANWQMAFGILHVSGRNVRPELVPLNKNGSFEYAGVQYG